MLVKKNLIRPFLIRLLHAPAVKVFLLSLSSWLLWFAYCKGRYWRDPHSAFFNSDHVYDLQYSAFREYQSNAYIDVASLPDTSLKKAVAKPEICAAFVTVKRDGKNYFAPAIGSMLEGLADMEREKLFLYVLFANTDPSVHLSWNATWLNKAADLVESYGVNDTTLAQIREMEEKRNFAEKGVFDYVYALEACYKTEAPYVAIFEDDIILADGWMAKTRHALQDIQDNVSNGNRASWENWLYLRLFYTETSLSWLPEDDFWYRNMWLTFTLAASAGFVLLIGARLFVPRTRKFLDNYAVATICILTIPAFTALLFMMGKYSLFPLRGVFELNKYGCCTQALVFPRQQVPDIANYLRVRKAGQTDTMLEDYADTTGKQRLALGPQLVQHVGLVSSRDNTEMNAQSTWAFWFEENDPEQLKKEHQKLLEAT